MKTIIQETRQEKYESPAMRSLQWNQDPVICHSAAGTLDEVDVVDPFLYDDIS